MTDLQERDLPPGVDGAPAPPVGEQQVSAGAAPSGTPGRRTAAGQWELVTDSTGVTAVTPAGAIAEARVSERDEQVVVEFWADPADLPRDLCVRLVTQAFSLPAVRPHRPVLVCAPRRSGAVLAHARRRVQGARTRAAGVTCLIEGRVGAAAPDSTRY